MKSLSLEAIQKQSPYPISQTLKGDFEFIAGNGVFYNISFKEEMSFGGCVAYQIIITNVENAHAPHDSQVKTIILAIIEEFFNANNDLMLYLCDTSDGREAVRNRLFLRCNRNQDRRVSPIGKEIRTKIYSIYH